MAGMAVPAIKAIPTGALTNVLSFHDIFFFSLQGFFPKKVHPDGLKEKKLQCKVTAAKHHSNSLLYSPWDSPG